MSIDTRKLYKKTIDLFGCEMAQTQAEEAIKDWLDLTGRYSSKIEYEKQPDDNPELERIASCKRPLPYPIDLKCSTIDQTEQWVLAAAIHDMLCREMSPIGLTKDSLPPTGAMRYFVLVCYVDKAIKERWDTIEHILIRIIDSLMWQTVAAENATKTVKTPGQGCPQEETEIKVRKWLEEKVPKKILRDDVKIKNIAKDIGTSVGAVKESSSSKTYWRKIR